MYGLKQLFLFFLFVPFLGQAQMGDVSTFQTEQDTLNEKPGFVADKSAEQLFSSHNLYNPFILTSKAIETLPVRGIKNMLAVQPGINLQDGALHFRGGLGNDVGYFLNGVQTNAPDGKNLIYFIPEALDDLQIYTGGFSAHFGNAAAGMVRGRLRTGGDKLKMAVNVFSDQVAAEGQSFLNTYSYQNRILAATIGGPLFSQRSRFFLAYENAYLGDNVVRFSKGFQFNGLKDINPVNMGNNNNLYRISYPDGFTPGNALERQALNASYLYDFGSQKLKISGAYTGTRTYIDREPWLNILRDRKYYEDETAYLISAALTGTLFKNISYHAQFSFMDYQQESGDSYLGHNWHAWYDSAAVNVPGAYKNAWQPSQNHIFNGIPFARKGQPFDSYQKQHKQQLSVRINFGYTLSKTHKINAGVEMAKYSLSLFNIAPSVMLFAADPAFGQSIGRTTYGSIKDVPVKTWALFVGQNYGYDVYGNKISGKKEYAPGLVSNGPAQPFYSAVFLEDASSWGGININAGMRINYLASKSRTLKNPANPAFDRITGKILDSEWRTVDARTRFNPRIALIYSLFDGFYIFGKYGAYSQMPVFSFYDEIPQESKNFEAGVQTSFFKKMAVRLNYHHTSYDYSAMGIYKVNGFDFLLNANPFYGLNTQMSYSLQNFDNTSFFIKNSAHIALNYFFNPDRFGAALGNTRINLLFSYNSGHDFLKVSTPPGGQTDPYTGGIDYLLNSASAIGLGISDTPANYNLDLYLAKSFRFFDRLSATFYLRVNNLLNTKNVVNVYPRSGTATDDGYLSDPSSQYSVSKYGQAYVDMYKAINIENGGAYKSVTGQELFGRPRQIFFGLNFNY